MRKGGKGWVGEVESDGRMRLVESEKKGKKEERGKKIGKRKR